MLVHRQRLAAGVAGDELKLGVSQARMPGQPGDCLMPESVRRGFDACLFCVLLDDLLDTPSRVPCVDSVVCGGYRSPGVAAAVVAMFTATNWIIVGLALSFARRESILAIWRRASAPLGGIWT